MAIRLIRGLYNLPSHYQGSVVTIGNFDGVHQGHQVLLSRLTAVARERGVPAAVIIFEPQPAEFFARGKAVIPRLTRLREKFHALAGCGVDAVLVLRFDAKLAAISAAEFVEKVLCKGLNGCHVIIGDDFHFGKNRQGDFAFLQKVAATAGFTVENMQSVLINNERVSSTRVRQALQKDDSELVKLLLGHPYYMEGRVVHGDKRGRSMGFPTANIHLHRQATPVAGVYVVRMHGIAAQPLAGVANIGTRPTIGGTRSLLEVYLFDFDQDIYNRQVTVEFCKKLRDEERYENLDLLIEQIKRDVATGREYFKLVELTGKKHE